MSLGGASASVFCSIVAPLVYDYSIIEYPLALLLASLGLWLLCSKSKEKLDLNFLVSTAFYAIWLLFLLWFCDLKLLNDNFNFYLYIAVATFLSILLNLKTLVIGTSAVLAILGVYVSSDKPGLLFAKRSFYGSSYVIQKDKNLRLYVHGNTIHGGQLQDSPQTPILYYNSSSPIKELLTDSYTTEKSGILKIIGLGVGGLIPYGKNFSEISFIELDPDVEHVAKTYFTYLKDSKVPVSIEIGDGRIMLKNASNRSISVLILDAFSSDAVPTHLLTKEALQTYIQKTNFSGQIIFNISNRYLHLARPLAKVASALHMRALVKYHDIPENLHESWKTGSAWVVIAKEYKREKFLLKHGWQEIKFDSSLNHWTDNHISILEALKKY
jgi:hypothetical protein